MVDEMTVDELTGWWTVATVLRLMNRQLMKWQLMNRQLMKRR